MWLLAISCRFLVISSKNVVKVTSLISHQFTDKCLSDFTSVQPLFYTFVCNEKIIYTFSEKDTSKVCEKSISSKLSKEKLTLFGNAGSTKCYRAQIVAKYSGKELIISQHKNDGVIPSDIKLKGNGFELYDSNAIAFYLANDQLKCSSDRSLHAQPSITVAKLRG